MPSGSWEKPNGSPPPPPSGPAVSAFRATARPSRGFEPRGYNPLMGDPLLLRLTDAPLDPAEALAFVADPAAGGTALFSGTVRDRSTAGDVTGLDYEAWPEQA